MTSMNQHGFTLLEMLLVVAIVAVLSLLSLPLGVNFFNSQTLEGVREQLVEVLGRAHSDAVTQKNDSAFGVYFAASPVSYTLYQGSSYNAFGRSTTNDEPYTVPSGTTFVWSSVGNPSVTEINFAEHTGTPNATGTIVISRSGLSSDILVDSYGNVSEQ